jgi:hypothetical protein
MYLVQILLPLRDNTGRAIPPIRFREIAAELADRFGGCTAYTRSPAHGLWKPRSNSTVHDEIVVYEVMTRALARKWWSSTRTKLEKMFRQQHIVIRAHGFIEL